jgi:hypothetical protein
MNSASVIATIILVIACFILPKLWRPLPFIIAACLIPMNQRVVIAGLDFTALRILVLASMLRIIVRGETRSSHWHEFDKLVLAWNFSGALIYTIQYGTFAAFINRCGIMYDSLGMYWIFRHFFQSFGDIAHTVKLFAICALISTPLIAAEKIKGSSLFAVFGPVGATFHRGRFRCAGPFPHYIMLGCFWVSLIPLWYGSFKAKIAPKTNMLGIYCAISLVYFSASSTPLLTGAGIVVFWLCYNYRHNGQTIFLCFCGFLLALHLLMKAPVWHLMARADIFGGSTGWHRYHLFDQFIKHTSEWFLLGTTSTEHWGAGLNDITNQYVLEAVRGGGITLFIFLVMMYKAIKIAGRASLLWADQPYHWIAWGICIALLGHAVSFLGVSYFGQILMLFYMVLAMTGFLQEKINLCNTNPQKGEKA